MQARLVSSGCDPLWVAPLWMVGPTGEVDFFERGCDRSSGYLANNAWNEGGKATANTDVTAYIELVNSLIR